MEAEKAKLRKFVAVDPSKCTGCSLCEFICALEKKEKTISPLRSRIRVIRISPVFNAAMTCRLCENAPCVRACSRNALIQSQSGEIIVDETKCNRCGWCIEACPYGGITLHPDKTSVLVCDLCNGEPKCVNFCPVEALKLVSSDEEAEKMWKTSLGQALLEIEKLAKIIKSKEISVLFEGVEEKTERFDEKFREIDKKYSCKS